MKDHRFKELLVVDVGSYSLKCAIVKKTGDNLTIKKALVIPISSNLYANGDIQDRNELANIIKEYVRDNGLRSLPVVFTFSSSSTITRVLDIPNVKENEMKEVIEYEIQQYLPSDISMYSIQYKTLSALSPRDSSVKVLVGTIPNAAAENFWSLAQACELTPAALDINTNALTKLVNFIPSINSEAKIAEENLALIEIGHSLIDISIFEKGEFQFNRRLLMGGKNIDQRIERVMDISIDEARLEKHSNIDINQNVFEYTDENRVFNAMKSGVDEWIAEIEKVIRFYVARKIGNKLDRCFVYGGGSAIMGIDLYMTSQLGINTEVIQLLNGVTIGPESDAVNLNLFMNAVGAFIRKEELRK